MSNAPSVVGGYPLNQATCTRADLHAYASIHLHTYVIYYMRGFKLAQRGSTTGIQIFHYLYNSQHGYVCIYIYIDMFV